MSGSESYLGPPEPMTSLKGPSTNANSLIRYMSSLYQDDQSSDLVLTVDGSEKRFKVHKIVLSRSPVFQSMLYGAAWHESQSPSIRLTELDFYIDKIEDFLQFLYGIPIQISWHNVEALVYFGDKYVLNALLDECWDFFTGLALRNGDLQCAMNAWKTIRRVWPQPNDRAASFHRTLAANLECVMLDKSIIQLMDKDDLKLLISYDNVVCRTEFSVYKLVENWLLLKPQEERLELMKELSSLLRLPYMHVQELSYVENSPKRLFPDESSDDFTTYQTFIKLLLCDAYKYHIMSQELRQTLMTQLPPMRLYLDLSCMKYRSYYFGDLGKLASWSKLASKSFPLRSSFSKFEQEFSSIHTCEITLMRKMNAGALSSSDRNCSNLLSLEISFPNSMKPHPFVSGHVFIHERKMDRTLRRLMTSFDISNASTQWEIKLEGFNFEDASKTAAVLSQYHFIEDSADVFLGLDIFLCTAKQ